MAEYIARKEANEWVADWLREDRCWHPYSKGKNIPTIEVFDIISRIPAADVQPVVHGRWEDSIAKYGILRHKCSACKKYSHMAYNYCPNCGADMRGADNG